jgi:penicillin-binding protein 1A
MLRLAFKFLVISSVFGLITLVVVSIKIIPNLPNIETLRDVQMQIPLRVYSHDRSLIAEFGEKKRIPVKIENTPKQLIHAFIAAEDDRFYVHPGVDWQGILRAVINLIKTGEKSIGGSTITMQVARNFFLTRERTYLRKLNEIYLSLKIEQELTKDEILELYLNVIYFGQRAYGIGAAAQVYYGRTVNELTLPQLALIAGLLPAPSTTNPITNIDRALDRRSYVLGRMLDEKYINQDEYNAAITAPATASLHRPTIDLDAPFIAEMVRRQMVDDYGDDATILGYKVYTTIRDKNQVAANHALRSAVLNYDTRHGYRGPESSIELESNLISDENKKLLETFPVIANLYPALITDVREQSITVYLSGIGNVDVSWDGLNWARKYINENFRGPQPVTATDIVKPGDIVRIAEDELGQWRLSQLPKVEGAIVSFNPRNGETLALTGGFDFYRSNFNRATQAKRQPGSGFKPFIYSAALESGFTAASIINDAPLVREFPGIEDAWRPENYSGKYFGPTRLREALIASRNIVSIRLLDTVGINTAMNHIAKFGFDTNALPHSLSLALGSGDLSPWDMATGYTVLANGGFQVKPYFIERIDDDNGINIFQADPIVVCERCAAEKEKEISANKGNNYLLANEESNIEALTIIPDENKDNDPLQRYAPRVVDPQNIWIMNSITRDVIRRGTGRRALVLNRKDLSGKTGTTNDQHDAWFFGYSPHIVAVSWVGFDDFRELGRNEVGGVAALPMWIDYMKVVLPEIPETNFLQPPGLASVRIDPATGKLASADNPNAIFEVFRSDMTPTEIMDEVPVNPFNDNSEDSELPAQPF